MKSIFSKIPSDWVVRNIPDVFFFQEGPGVRKWQFRENGVKLLNGSNINNGILDLLNTKIYLDEIEANGKYKHFLVNEGDLVIASSGVVVDNFHNKIAIVKKEHLPLCMNTSTIRFQVLDNKLAILEFLKYFLKTNIFKMQIRKLITGSAQLNFGPSHLEKIQIPLPPLEDQIRIANVLTRLEKLIAKRKESIKALDELLKSTFMEMFGDPQINPKQFPLVKLQELYIDPKNGTKCGPFGSALKKEEFVDNGIPVWNMDNISLSGQMVTPFRMWITPEKYRSLEAYSVLHGDVVISRAGTVGKMCVARMSDEKSIISTNLIRVRFGNKLLPIYFVLLMKYCKGRVGRLKTGADGTFTHMNTGVLDDLTFPYPPLELQNQFAAIVEKVESIKTKYTDSLTELENIYGSISQQAFKGELDLSKIPVVYEMEVVEPKN